MSKTVGFIPLLLGSTRIPDKNLILVDGYPMAFYVIEACKAAGVFDEIYINSEHDQFARIADMLGVKFHRRPAAHGGSACQMKNKSRDCRGTRCQVHDHYITDFIEHVPCDNLVQIHATSPLLKPETIRAFTEKLRDGQQNSLFTIEQRQVETFLDRTPVNFSTVGKRPTQTLPPTQMISWALSGWKTQAWMASYRRDDPQDAGPTFCEPMELFPIARIEALDADTWEDLYMIEACLRHRRRESSLGKHRLTERVTSIERNLQELIARDGVVKFCNTGANVMHSNLDEIKAKMGKAPWIYLLVNTMSDQTGIICQQPGEGARKHCHVTHDEWWVILEGEFEWQLDGGRVIHAKKNDVVFMPQGTVHRIVCVGTQQGMRLACGGQNMEHIYVKA